VPEVHTLLTLDPIMLNVLQDIGQQRYNESVDWYALGILIYEMLFGLPPYQQVEQNHLILYDRIQVGPSKITFPPAALSDQAKDLIMKLTEGDPLKRYGNMCQGAADVFVHPWFREVDWMLLEAREITAPYLPTRLSPISRV
jgi:serine/threonine protein kinase